MRLAGLLLFCIIGGCCFLLGILCRIPVGETRAPGVVVVVPNESPPEVRSPVFCDPPGRCERQVGTLTTLKEGGSTENRVLPLFANKSWANRDRFFYSARTDGFNPLIVPIFHKGRNCMTDRIGARPSTTGTPCRCRPSARARLSPSTCTRTCTEAGLFAEECVI